jgi:hypothetical protein
LFFEKIESIRIFSCGALEAIDASGPNSFRRARRYPRSGTTLGDAQFETDYMVLGFDKALKILKEQRRERARRVSLLESLTQNDKWSQKIVAQVEGGCDD